MEYTHTQKNIHTTPRKLRLVADMIRRMNPQQAIETLQFVNKVAAAPLAKAIKTALANASKDRLSFKKIEINEGPRMKRFRAGSRGKANPYKRRLSHIKIVLTDEVTREKKQVISKREKAIEQKKGGMDDSAVETAKTEKVMSESSKS